MSDADCLYQQERTRALREGRALAHCYENALSVLTQHLMNCLPRFCRQLAATEAEAWPRLIREFYREGTMHSPFFYDIPEHFLDFLLKKGWRETKPCLFDLAHFEWICFVVDIMWIDVPAPLSTPTDRQCEEASYQLNPTALILAYRYPVFSKQNFTIPRTAFVCVFRTADDEVRYLELERLDAYALQQLKAHAMTAAALFHALEQKAAEKITAAFKANYQKRLQYFIDEQIIVRAFSHYQSEFLPVDSCARE
jgi:hypothetical protein